MIGVRIGKPPGRLTAPVARRSRSAEPHPPPTGITPKCDEPFFGYHSPRVVLYSLDPEIHESDAPDKTDGAGQGRGARPGRGGGLALLLAFTGATSASVVHDDRLGLDSPAR